MSEQDSSSSGVRASDAERDAVVGRLNQAVGEGRLTLGEFSERLEVAYAARTRGDLDPLLRDLPAVTNDHGAAPASTSDSAVASRTAVASSGGQARGTHWNVSPIGGVRHRGSWQMPRHTVSITVIGGVDVDLGGAELAAPEVTITKVSVIGGVNARVPRGMRVQVSNFSIIGGRSVHLGGSLAPNAPVLHIRSFSIIGGVRVRESRKQHGPEVGN